MKEHVDVVAQVLGNMGPLEYRWHTQNFPRIHTGYTKPPRPAISLGHLGQAIEGGILMDQHGIEFVAKNSTILPPNMDILLEGHHPEVEISIDWVLRWDIGRTVVHLASSIDERIPEEHMTDIWKETEESGGAWLRNKIPGEVRGWENTRVLRDTKLFDHSGDPHWGLIHGDIRFGPFMGHLPDGGLKFQRGDSSVKLVAPMMRSGDNSNPANRMSYVARLDGPDCVKLSDDVMMFLSVVCGAGRQMLIIADRQWNVHRVLPYVEKEKSGERIQLSKTPDELIGWFPAFTRHIHENGPELVYRWIDLNKTQLASTSIRDAVDFLRFIAALHGMNEKGVELLLKESMMCDKMRQYYKAAKWKSMGKMASGMRAMIAHPNPVMQKKLKEAYDMDAVVPAATMLRDACRTAMIRWMNMCSAGITRFSPKTYVSGRPVPSDFLASDT